MENLHLDFLAVVFGLVILCLAMVLKWLTLSGSIAAFFISLILLWGGLAMFILPMVLFIGGSLLSKLNRDESEKEGRNALQVLANGGVGMASLVYTYNTGTDNYLGYMAFLISFSISICDTFSSETGRYFNGKTLDILTFKPIKKGLSGGISLEGTLGGLAGVLVGVLLLYSCLDMSVKLLALVTVFGFAGMLLDSVLGSKFQAKYISKTGEIEERKSTDNTLCSGYTWCTNDVVNITSNAIAVALYIGMTIAGLF